MSKQILIGLFFAVPSLFTMSGAFAADTYTPIASNVNGVKVTATLQAAPPGAKTWDFEVVMENQAGPLNEVMDTTSELVADKKQYFALGWEGAPPGGHRRRGLLHFKPIVPKPATVELRILMNGEAAPRSFSWRLK